MIALETTSATLQHAASGRSWSGQVYVATPQLLAAFGIKASQLNPDADILSMRPGLSGISQMQLVYGNYFGQNGGPEAAAQRRAANLPCPAGQCLANPVIEEVGALPSGTSAPNTVITEYALQQARPAARGLNGWMILLPHPLTAAQITSARLTAAARA